MKEFGGGALSVGFVAIASPSLGYASNKRVYHVQAGNWHREHRGIYRLALYPEPDRFHPISSADTSYRESSLNHLPTPR